LGWFVARQAMQASSKNDVTPKVTAELTAERTAREAVEGKLKAANLSLGRREAMIADLKSKVAGLQEQLDKDDRFELIDRAVNAEVSIPCLITFHRGLVCFSDTLAE
jgi:hypothetical protein